MAKKFEFWKHVCCLYEGENLQAVCTLGRMTKNDISQLDYLNLYSISNGELKIWKKIVKYNYRERDCFVELLKEIKKRTTLFATVPIDNEDQVLFHLAGYYGKMNAMSYFPSNKVFFVSHTHPFTL